MGTWKGPVGFYGASLLGAFASGEIGVGSAGSDFMGKTLLGDHVLEGMDTFHLGARFMSDEVMSNGGTTLTKIGSKGGFGTHTSNLNSRCNQSNFRSVSNRRPFAPKRLLLHHACLLYSVVRISSANEVENVIGRQKQNGLMSIIDEFQHSYVFDVAPDWPMQIEDVVSCESQHLLGMHTQEYQEIRFYPNAGGSWIGRFERGERGDGFAHTILSTPDAGQACVISSGAGYWVDVGTRKVNSLKTLPITQAVASRRNEIIVLITWKEIIAYRSGAIIWCLKDLVSDRLQVTTVSEGLLDAIGYDGGDRKVSVDLSTGLLLE